MTLHYSLFISCAKGLEYLLEAEVKKLGFAVHRVSPHGVYGEATLSMIYHLCLWSRLAQRIQLMLFTGEVVDQKTLYTLVHAFAWHTLFTIDKTFAIEFHGTSPSIRNTMFGAQVVKDALVDSFRASHGDRPMIARDTPDVRIHAYLKNDTLSVSFDLTGYGLHQRGYRLEAGEAPIKENLAAALLVRAGWLEMTTQQAPFYDPCCGAGTLVIEAAMIAAHQAPGLLRHDQAFLHWCDHQPEVWDEQRLLAQQQIQAPATILHGSDIDASVIEIARANARRAGVDAWVEFHHARVQEPLTIDFKTQTPGLVMCNPPYGERLTQMPGLTPLYEALGRLLHTHYQHWHAAVLTSDPLLAKAIGLQAKKRYTFYNGALECQLYCITLDAQNRLKDPAHQPCSEAAQMFANRLRKNYQHLQTWAKRSHIECYRVYDADLPEYAYAIDIYKDYAVLQEYAAPSSIPVPRAAKRSQEVLQLTPGVLGFAPDKIIHKQRKQQKGTDQYQKIDRTQHMMTVREGEALLQVNLYDYLDTGLFLDHRRLRQQFAKLKPGTRFLNCFCYTASASVHAAMAGALTTNVDLSTTYLEWAEQNFRLNHLDLSQHQFVRYDCLEWLKVAADQFDVIFLDPPSFSNSKRMSTTLDIQRDHDDLIRATMQRLKPDGILYFSTNCRTFKLSPQLRDKYVVEAITAQTIDLDFKRNARIHQSYTLRHGGT